jgi:hypothetical protein
MMTPMFPWFCVVSFRCCLRQLSIHAKVLAVRVIEMLCARIRHSTMTYVKTLRLIHCANAWYAPVIVSADDPSPPL